MAFCAPFWYDPYQFHIQFVLIHTKIEHIFHTNLFDMSDIFFLRVFFVTWKFVDVRTNNTIFG